MSVLPSTQFSYPKATTLVSGLYLLLVIVLATVLLDSPAASPASAETKNQNESVTWNLNFQPVAIQIDSFARITGGATVRANDPFRLGWNTSTADGSSFPYNVRLKRADGTPLATGLDPDGSFSLSEPAGSYTYVLEADDAAGNVSATDAETVVVKERQKLYQLSDPTVAISGQPNATSSVTIEISGTYGSSVDISNIDVPKDDAGVPRFLVSSNQSSLSTAGPTEARVDIKTLNISIDDAPYQITIHGDSAGGADNENDAVIDVDLVGFSPRTIEEF